MIVANHRVCFTAFPSSSPQAKVRSETVFRFVVFGTVRASVSGYHVGHIGYLTNAKGENLIQEDQIREFPGNLGNFKVFQGNQGIFQALTRKSWNFLSFPRKSRNWNFPRKS